MTSYQWYPACLHHHLVFSFCPCSFSSFCTVWKSYMLAEILLILTVASIITVTVNINEKRYIFRNFCSNVIQNESLTFYRLILSGPAWWTWRVSTRSWSHTVKATLWKRLCGIIIRCFYISTARKRFAAAALCVCTVGDRSQKTALKTRGRAEARHTSVGGIYNVHSLKNELLGENC